MILTQRSADGSCKMMKPDNYIETNHLMELKDRTEYARDIYACLRDLYGICYQNASIDERTGELENKYD